MERGALELVRGETFEPLSAHDLSRDFVDVLEGVLPEGWSTRRRDVWVDASDGSSLPEQGFKIHVAAVPENAPTCLRIVAPECVERGVRFKMAGDPTLLRLLNSKNYRRGHSGKFMTLYPRGQEQFEDLLAALYRKTRDEDVHGPYILSDRRYRDSRVLFYRYGGFKKIERLEVDGTTTAMIRAPDGELEPDVRRPYFELPDWVEDPFGGSSAVDHEGDPVLNDRYRIEAPLDYSNSGGVYAASDMETGRDVVIKEARPLTNRHAVEDVFLDAVELLEREWAILEALAPLDCVPDPLDLFDDWEHRFLVEERFEGTTMWSYWAASENILAPYVRLEGRVEAWVPKFRDLASSLLDALEAVHEEGVLVGDLSPQNVLVDPDTRDVKLIDFETAVFREGDEDFMPMARRWATPGFAHPARTERSRLTPEDDHYAAGMLLYAAVVPVQAHFDLNPEARPRFLREFVRMGVPEEVREIVDSLTEGRPDRAREILDRWSS